VTIALAAHAPPPNDARSNTVSGYRLNRLGKRVPEMSMVIAYENRVFCTNIYVKSIAEHLANAIRVFLSIEGQKKIRF